MTATATPLLTAAQTYAAKTRIASMALASLALLCTPYTMAEPQFHIQQADGSTNALPMKNLRVEVRQLGGRAATGQHIAGGGRIILEPGNSRGSFGITGGEIERAQQRNLSQQALVLNGRTVRFNVGSETALRVIQTYATPYYVSASPSTVFIQRQNGFSAQPSWYGGNDVDVTISTNIASSDPYRVRTLENENAQASTSLRLPINQWVTIAESADEQYDSDNGTLRRSHRSTNQALKVQMRVTVPRR